MYTHAQNHRHHHLSSVEQLRWLARASALTLLLIWASLVAAEAITRGLPSHVAIVSQAVPLAVVFGGYAIGWRHELFGGAFVLLGMAAFFAATRFTSGWWPPAEAVWFAAPGILYLLTALCDHRRRAP
jgi:hypothetical protein